MSETGAPRRTALVTGASSGFGVEFTRLFGAEGWDVVMVARSGAAMETVAQEVEERDRVEVTVLPRDLSAAASAELVASLDQRGVVVDALVNNGVLHLRRVLARRSGDAIRAGARQRRRADRAQPPDLPGMIERRYQDGS